MTLKRNSWQQKLSLKPRSARIGRHAIRAEGDVEKVKRRKKQEKLQLHHFADTKPWGGHYENCHVIRSLRRYYLCRIRFDRSRKFQHANSWKTPSKIKTLLHAHAYSITGRKHTTMCITAVNCFDR